MISVGDKIWYIGRDYRHGATLAPVLCEVTKVGRRWVVAKGSKTVTFDASTMKAKESTLWSAGEIVLDCDIENWRDEFRRNQAWHTLANHMRSLYLPPLDVSVEDLEKACLLLKVEMPAPLGKGEPK